MIGSITTKEGTITFSYEDERVADQSTADVSFNGEEISTMIYDEDLDQWYDCLNPGEVSGSTEIECARQMIEFYRRK